MEPYYYSQMNKTQQAACISLKNGLMAFAPSIQVSGVGSRELGDIFFQLRLDYPEIFYAVGFQYQSYRGSDNITVIPEYLFDKAKIKDHQKAMKTRAEKLARPAQSLSDWEKERYIHDFICTNVRYDKLKKPYSHEIIGPLGQGVGVCEGIAKSVKLLCDALGIWCMIAISDANQEKQIKYRHAWNIIRLGKSYYHLDTTFDVSLSLEGMVRYDYFNLDDKQFFRDHEPVIYGAPRCEDGGSFYYKEKKLSFTKTEEAAKRAEQAAKKKKPLVFQWRGGYLNRETLMELCSLLDQAAARRGMHAKITLNRAQAVFAVEFTAADTGADREIDMNESRFDDIQ